MGRTPRTYDAAKLLKYDDVIVLCFKQTYAWLEIRNYKIALYDGGSADEIEGPIVIGAAPSPRQAAWLVNLGLLLDPLAVIRFQRNVLPFAKKFGRGGPVAFIQDVVCSGLEAAGIPKNHLQPLRDATDFGTAPYRRMEDTLRAAGWWRIQQQRHDDYVDLGFVGYFPQPSLIAEEERTWLFKSGKTKNQDSRELGGIPSSAPVPSKNAIDLFIDSLDQELYQEREAKGEKVQELRKHLHAGLPRVSCFAFRGDDREPMAIRASTGFLPSTTRKDIDHKSMGRDQIQAVAKELDEALKSSAATISAKQKRAKGTKKDADTRSKYLDVLRQYAFFHLHEYTKDQTFRGYTSTTKSIAIAKHFANAWKTDPKCQTWCYVVRCHGGYELPSRSAAGVMKPDEGLVFPLGTLGKIHEFANYFEQEIAVPGAIWWDHVVGFRLLDCDKTGQFFAGPIYLREPRFWEVTSERHAFSDLFEVLSGRSQGPGEDVYKSYRPKGGPFELVPNTVDGVQPPT